MRHASRAVRQPSKFLADNGLSIALGALMLATGICLFLRQTWAGISGIVLAMLSAIANFFFIPYYPIWSLVVIGLAVWIIWALTRPGVIRT